MSLLARLNCCGLKGGLAFCVPLVASARLQPNLLCTDQLQKGYPSPAQRSSLGIDQTYGPLDVDFFSATSHVLEGSGLDTEAFRKQIRTLRTWLADRGLRDHGLLITEMGAAFGQHTPNEVGVFLEETVDFVMHARDPEIGLASDENRLVQRFAWFTAHPLPLGEKFQLLGLGALYVDFSQTALFTSAGQLTRLGQRYARQIQRRPAARPSPNPPPI